MKTRFVFKNDVHEVNAVIEGPEAWVNYIADQLGLGGECGWTTKISGTTEGPRADPDNFQKELPGPPPDPQKYLLSSGKLGRSIHTTTMNRSTLLS